MISRNSKELDVLRTQVGWLDIYAHELQLLEQWNMPAEWRERAVRLRNQSAPMFFNLASALLLDALVQGLANILDKPATFGKDNLTLEYAIHQCSDTTVKTVCAEKLSTLRSGVTYIDIKKARNRILSHSDHATLMSYDTMNPADFPGLALGLLQAMVSEIRDLVSKLTGQPPSALVHADWKGVETLFERLEAT